MDDLYTTCAYMIQYCDIVPLNPFQPAMSQRGRVGGKKTKTVCRDITCACVRMYFHAPVIMVRDD